MMERLSRVQKNDIKVAKNYFHNLDSKAKSEYEAIISMPNKTKEEKAAKAKAEREFLKSAMSDGAINNLDSSRFSALMNAYTKKSGNVYEGTSVSDEHRKAEAARQKAYESKKQIEKEAHEKYGVDFHLPYKIYSERVSAMNNDPQVKKAKRALKRAESRLTAVALKDIGFENNRINRKYGKYIWEWD